MICLRAFAALIVFLGLPAASVHAQSKGSPDAASRSQQVQRDEAFPSTGLGATTIGERVIILPDGTWKVDNYYQDDEVTAVSDHGRLVMLTRTKDPQTGEFVRTWSYTTGHGGPLQVVVSRAITTDRSLHSKNDNCIPVITVRNLTSLGLFRLVAELEFTSANGKNSATSIMAGPLDDGEQGDFQSGPLFLETCTDLTAKLHIPYCKFENGVDCRTVVSASGFGTIPTALYHPEAETEATKSN